MSTWFPVITLVIGAALTMTTTVGVELLKDRLGRDRAQREADEKFQRDTLFRLQQLVNELYLSAIRFNEAQAGPHEIKLGMALTADETARYAADKLARFYETFAVAMWVRDQRLRELLHPWLNGVRDVNFGPEKADWNVLTATLAEIHARIGEILSGSPAPPVFVESPAQR